MNLKRISNIFPSPKFLSLPFAGLSISDSAIHCIQFGGGKKPLRIEKYTERALPADVIVSGQINNKEALVDILKVLKKENIFPMNAVNNYVKV